jgi:hypothetical protein
MATIRKKMKMRDRERGKEEQPLDVEALKEQLSHEVALGVSGLALVLKQKRPVSYVCWSRAVSELALSEGRRHQLEGARALWKYLIRVPAVAALHKASVEAQKERLKGVLPPGTQLDVHMPDHCGSPWPKIELSARLDFQQGKEGLLESAPVEAQLHYEATDAHSASEEAERLRTTNERVTLVEPGRVVVKVWSLNEAYTFASTRLEPLRRSHTGRIYDKLSVRGRKGERIFLEEFRVAAECGELDKLRARLMPARKPGSP